MRHYIFAIILLIVSNSIVYGQEKKTANTLLWKIEKKGKKTSYLFGTMHVKDERVFNFQDTLYPIFDQVESFAMEVHPDSVWQYLIESYTSAKVSDIIEGEDYEYDIKKYLDKDKYRKLNKRFSKDYGVPLDGIKNRNPYLIETSIGQSVDSKEERPVFLDLYLYSIAKNKGISTYGLESMTASIQLKEEQDSIEIEQDLNSLLKIVLNKDLGERMIKIYTDEDLDALIKLYNDTTIADDYFKQRILIDRNFIMFNSIDSLIEDKSTFIAVGAAHLPGSDGLIDILQKNGYTVSPILSPKTGKNADYQFDKVEIEWKEKHIKNIGMKFKMPIEPIDISVPLMQEKMYMAMDLTTGTNYLGIGIMIGADVIQNNSKQTLNMLIESYMNKTGFTQLSSVDIEIEGAIGKDIVIGSYLPLGILRFIVRDNKFAYVLGVFSENSVDENNKHFDKFLNSISFTDYHFEEWDNYVSDIGGFSADFPEEPTIKDYTYNENTDEELKMYIYMASDKKTNSYYNISYFDFNPINIYNSSDAYIRQFIANSMEGVPENSYEIIIDSTNGIPVYHAEALVSGSIMKVFCSLRGNRLYIAVSTINPKADKTNFEQFFKSFSYTDYKKTEWKHFNSKTYNFEVDVLNSMDTVFSKEEMDVDYSDQNILNSYFIPSIDPYTGNDFYLNVDEYSPYYSIKDTAYFNFLKSQYIGWNDSIINVDTLDINGRKGFNIISKQENRTIRKRSTIVLDGLNIICLTSFFENGYSETTQNFHESFKFTSDFVESEILKDKTALLLENLKSNESDKVNIAIKALGAMEFDSLYYPEIADLLVHDFKPDSNNVKIKKSVLIKLNNLPYRSEFSSYIDSIYHLLPDNLSLQLTAINIIQSANTLESAFNTISKFIKLSPKENDYRYNTILFNLQDSLNLYAAYTPAFLTLLDNPDKREAIINGVSNYLDYKIVSNEVFEPYKDQIRRAFYKEEKKRKTKLKTDGYAYFKPSQTNSLEILSDLNALNDDDLNYILKLLKEEEIYAYSKIPLVFLALKNHQTVSKKHIQEITKNDGYAFILHRYLASENLTEFFPKKLMNRDHIALGEIVTYLDDIDEYADQIKLAKKFKTSDGGLVYSYKIKYDYEGSEDFIAFSGPYYNLENLTEIGSKTGTNWDQYEEGKEEMIYQEYVDEFDTDPYRYVPTYSSNKKYYKFESIFKDISKSDKPISYNLNEDIELIYHFTDGKLDSMFYVKNDQKNIFYKKKTIQIESLNIIENPEVSAAFDGCDLSVNNSEIKRCSNRKLSTWIIKNLTFSKKQKKNNQESNIKFAFTIDKNGNTRNIEITGGTEELNLILKTKLEDCPKFKSALIKNNQVDSKLLLSLKFEEMIESDFNSKTVLADPFENNHFQEAYYFFREEEYENCIEKLNEALKKQPDNVYILDKRSICYFRLNEFEKALEDINFTIKYITNDADLYSRRAEILESLNQVNDALLDCEKALEIEPESMIALGVKSDCLLRLNKVQEALEIQNYLIEKNPYEIELYTRRSSSYMRIDKKQEAIDDLTKIIQIDSTYYGAYVNRGLITGIILDDYESALKDFEYVIKNSDNIVDVRACHNNLGMVYTSLERYDEAIAEFDYVIANNDHIHLAYSNRSFAKYKLGQLDEAYEDVMKSLELNHQNSWAYKNKALILIAQGKNKEACIAIESSLRLGYTSNYGDEVEKLQKENCK